MALKEGIIGAWVRDNDPNQSIIIDFKNDNSYMLHISDMTFDGNYSLEKDTVIQMVDKYCGTKLLGKYRVKYEDGHLKFTLKNDQFCTRKDFLLQQRWVKTQQPEIEGKPDVDIPKPRLQKRNPS